MYRIAWFSPLSNTDFLLSSYYSSQIVPLLAKDCEIELFGEERDLAEFNSFHWINAEDRVCFPIFHYLRAFARHKEKPFDCFIYHLEDHERCNFVSRALALFPGITFFHDVNFNRLELHKLRHATNGVELNNQMDEVFGKDSPRLGDWHARGWPIETCDEIFVRGKQFIEASPVKVAFGAATKRHLGKYTNRNEIELSTYPLQSYDIKKFNRAREIIRRRLKLQESDVLFAYTGRQVLAHRILSTLEAFAQVIRTMNGTQNCGPFLLWIVPDRATEEWAWSYIDKVSREFCEELELHVFVVEADSLEGVQSLLSAADVMLGLASDVELRSPQIEVLLALGLNIPTIVSKLGFAEAYADSVLCKIELGEKETEQLVDNIFKFIEDEKIRHAFSVSLREVVSNCHAPILAKSDMIAIIEKSQKRVSNTVRKFSGLLDQAELKHGTELKEQLIRNSLDLAKEVNPMSLNLLQESFKELVSKAADDFSWHSVSNNLSIRVHEQQH